MSTMSGGRLSNQFSGIITASYGEEDLKYRSPSPGGCLFLFVKTLINLTSQCVHALILERILAEHPTFYR